MTHFRTPPTLIGLMVLAVVLTALLAGIIVRTGPDAGQGAPAAARGRAPSPQATLGVRAEISAGDARAERTLPSLSFALQPGESLDHRIPAGPFTARMTVSFRTGDVREARVGAEIQGGQLIILRDGRPPLLADHAGDDPKMILTNVPESFSRAPQTLVYEFKATGDGPCRMRALWQPIEAQVPLPLPSKGAPVASVEMRGAALVRQHQCVACHRSADQTRQRSLAMLEAPVLGEIGRRVRPNWLRHWLADPAAVNPSATMPRLFHDPAASAEDIEDLTHFLVSLGGPIDLRNVIPNPELIATGMAAYHTIGCVACHGPLEPLEKLPGGRVTSSVSYRTYVQFGDLSVKTSPGELARFLQDPLKHWPSGRMPSSQLTPMEAQGIAHYLISRTASHDTPPEASPPFVVEPDRATRGREAFARHGCADCHSMGAGVENIDSRLSAPPLESLTGAGLARGCLDADARIRSPRFTLSQSQREAVIEYLRSVDEQRCGTVPIDDLALNLTSLNCTACHQYLSSRGPESAVAQHFNTVEEADLGDEGRLPPDLSDVGAKLNAPWVHRVLDGSGRARPYMGARMPHFGEKNVEALPRQLAAAAGILEPSDDGPVNISQMAPVGRELVGSKGLNCIQCHSVAGRASTGTPGPDLAGVPERLRFDAFNRWLHDPAKTRPGTRMPSFFVGGKSGFQQHFEGDAAEQIKAIWAYLSLGELMPPPEGMLEPAGLLLQPVDEPIVFRTFMKQAGVRAIACGFPERVHCAFDADTCRLAMVWTGDFLNAGGAWAARGGTQTNPADPAWISDGRHALQLVAGGDAAPLVDFKGYRLDERGRPIFMYQLKADEASLEVQEQPLPLVQGVEARLVRRFKLTGQPGQLVLVNAEAKQLHDATVRTGDRGSQTELVLDSQGSASFDMEVSW